MPSSLMARSIRRRRQALAVLALALLTPLVAACGLSGTNDGGYIVGNSQVEAVPVGKRTDPIELTGTTLDGKQFNLASTRGKVTVINTWWSGCGPCNTEMPMLQQASKALGASTDFVGINIRDNSAEDGLAFQHAHGVTYPSIYSPDGKAVLAFPSAYAPRSVPATAILDTKGRVAAIIRGEIPSKLTLTETVQCVADPSGQGCADFE